MKDPIYSVTIQFIKEHRMSYEPYTLNIISHLPEFKGRPLKKFNFDGVDHIGVYGNETFEVIFKNNTWQRIQVKLSIDGTDVLTGNPADLSSSGEMWLVEPHSTLSLKAWPETTQGGAAFIFAGADKSVAVNTHGDVSSRGVIAAAVFVEGYLSNQIWGGGFIIDNTSSPFKCRTSFNDNTNFSSYYSSLNDSSTFGSCSLNSATDEKLKSLAGVGAGQYVNQQVTTVPGLRNPVLSMQVKVRFEWWDTIIAMAKEKNVYPTPGSGFPGEERKLINLGQTPRIGGWIPPLKPRPEITRF